MYNSNALDLTIEKFFCPSVKKQSTTLFDITQAEKREKYGVIYRSKPAWNNTLSFSMISQVFDDYMSECSLFSEKKEEIEIFMKNKVYRFTNFWFPSLSKNELIDQTTKQRIPNLQIF